MSIMIHHVVAHLFEIFPTVAWVPRSKIAGIKAYCEKRDGFTKCPNQNQVIKFLLSLHMLIFLYNLSNLYITHSIYVLLGDLLWLQV